MATKYCTSCGHKHDFSFETPVFCEGCGKNFVTGIIASQTVVSVIPKTSIRQTSVNSAAIAARIQQELEDDTPIPELNPADISVELDTTSRPTITERGVVNAAHVGASRPRGIQTNAEDVQRAFAEKFRRDRESSRED